MAAKTNLLKAQIDWNRRMNEAAQYGVPREALHPIMQADMQKVQQGGTGMSDQEAIAAAVSAFRGAHGGQPVIPDKQPSTKLTAIPGNVGTDIRNIVLGFVPGVGKFIHHLPSEVTDQAKLIAGNKKTGDKYNFERHYQGESLGKDLTAILRNASRSPLSALVPGVHTAASLTTSEGRKELERHPVGTVLDVLPIISSAAHLGVFGEGAEAGSALEALQAGSPFKAAARATGLSAKAGEWAKSLGLSSDIREKLMQPLHNITTQMHYSAVKVWREQILPNLGKLSEEDRSVIFEASRNYSPSMQISEDPIKNAHYHALIQVTRDISKALEQEQVNAEMRLWVPTPTGTESYALSEPVAKAWQRVKALENTINERVAQDKDITSLEKQLHAQQEAFQKQVLQTPPDRYRPEIASRIQDLAGDAAQRLYHGKALEEALTRIAFGDFKAVIGDKEFTQLARDAASSWTKLAEQGLDPVWLGGVNKSGYESLMHPEVIRDTHLTRNALGKSSSFINRIFDFSPVMSDVHAGLMKLAVDRIQKEGAEEFFNNHLRPMVKNGGELLQEYTTRLDNAAQSVHHFSNVEAEARSLMQREWKEFNPSDYGGPNVRDAFLPRHIAEAIDRLLPRNGKGLPAKGLYSRSMGLYRFFVLTGPRHLAHVALGGTMFVALREPGAILQYLRAGRLVRGIMKDGVIPEDMPEVLNVMHGRDIVSTDQLFNFAAGKWAGNRFVKAFGTPAKAIGYVEEFMANTEKVAVLLHGEAKGLDVEEAMNLANKTLVDLATLTPVERQIIRQVFPFYAFTKHLFRYIFTYPIDHPYRASIISRFAEMESGDWKSGLPQKMMQLFFLGQPDSKGNVTTVDFRSINPFRSVSNDFSLAGFVSALNPYATAVGSAAGINVLSATPELYPEVTYDPYSGSLVAKRKDVVPKLLEAFVPEFGAVDHFLTATDTLRSLKRSSPEAYRRQLFQSLNLPFEWATTNVTEDRAKAEVNRFKQAQTSVSNYLKTGDFSQISGYPLVPYNGTMMTPQQLASLYGPTIKAAHKKKVSPKSIFQPTKRVKGQPLGTGTV